VEVVPQSRHPFPAGQPRARWELGVGSWELQGFAWRGRGLFTMHNFIRVLVLVKKRGVVSSSTN
jgi:hypothetical protein